MLKQEKENNVLSACMLYSKQVSWLWSQRNF